jgi:hypothetical protein
MIKAMKLLDFPKKEKRNAPLTVRIPPSTMEKLRSIAKKHDASQSEVIERLVEVAYSEMMAGKGRHK